ncbi:Putative RxLR effector [Phytophthora palmivora]|uniref:RxLR effector n=1 Tax=Phytophthora palmivora TaxID=4796 RepID=A0A2P4YD05_9STRA|nr:Putative RxLR effector [Phytophthora palmivora]
MLVVVIIFICCEGVFAVCEANRLPTLNEEQLLTIRSADQPTSSNKRLLRKHIVSDDYTKAGEEKFGKEERVSSRIFLISFCPRQLPRLHQVKVFT